MTRPTVLDMDLVVVPREADGSMIKAALDACPIAPPGIDGKEADYYCTAGEYSAMLSASPYPTAWDDVRKYVEGLERKEARATASLTGLLDALEHHTGEWHGIMAIRHLVDRAEAAEARIAELEKRLADAERVIEPFAPIAAVYDGHEDSDPIWAGFVAGVQKRITVGHLRAARAYMEGK